MELATMQVMRCKWANAHADFETSGFLLGFDDVVFVCFIFSIYPHYFLFMCPAHTVHSAGKSSGNAFTLIFFAGQKETLSI